MDSRLFIVEFFECCEQGVVELFGVLLALLELVDLLVEEVDSLLHDGALFRPVFRRHHDFAVKFEYYRLYTHMIRNIRRICDVTGICRSSGASWQCIYRGVWGLRVTFGRCIGRGGCGGGGVCGGGVREEEDWD